MLSNHLLFHIDHDAVTRLVDSGSIRAVDTEELV